MKKARKSIKYGETSCRETLDIVLKLIGMIDYKIHNNYHYAGLWSQD